MERLLHVLSTSSDPEQVKAVESELQQYKKDPNVFVPSLLAVLLGGDKSIQKSAAVLLRPYIDPKTGGLFNSMEPKKEPGEWERLSDENKTHLMKGLIQILRNGEDRAVCLSCVELIVAISQVVLRDDGNWPELFSLIQEVSRATTTKPVHRESILNLLDGLMEFKFVKIKDSIMQVMEMLSTCLDDEKSEVRTAALKATVTALLAVDQEVLPKFQDLVPRFFQSMSKADCDLTIQTTCAHLADLATLRPDFFKKYLDDMVKNLRTLATNSQLEEKTRHLAYEILLLLAEHGRKFTRKSADFVQTVISTAFVYCDSWDVTIPWEIEDICWCPNDQEDTNYGMTAIYRLSTSLGPQTYLKVAMPMILEHIKSTNWIHIQTALWAIHRSIEGVIDVWEDNHKELLEMIIPCFKHERVEVRYAALYCLTEMCIDWPTIGQTFGSIMLPALSLVTRTPNEHHHILTRVCECIGFLCLGIKKETILPCLDEIIDLFTSILTNPSNNDKITLLRSAISGVSAVSVVIKGQEFVKHYETFVPIFMKLVEYPGEGELINSLKGKSMEAIGMIGSCVGADVFAPVASKLMTLLIKQQEQLSSESSDSQIWNSTMTLFTRIMNCMREKFIPFLQHVIPGLLRSAQKEGGCFIGEHDVCKDPDAHVVTVNVRGHGTQQLVLNTSNLEEKATAMQMLTQYLKLLPVGFYPWTSELANITIKLLRYPYNANVRFAAIAILPHLFTSVKRFHEEQKVQENEIKTKLGALMEMVFDPLLTAAYLSNCEENICVLESFSEIFTNFGYPISADYIKQTLELLDAIYTDIQKRMKGRLEEEQSPDFDEEEAAIIEQEAEEDYCLLGQLVDVMTEMVKVNNDLFFECFQASKIKDRVTSFLDDKIPAKMRYPSFCVIDDLIEFGGQKAVEAYAKPFKSLLIHAIHSTNKDLRQAALYGVGVIAMRNGFESAAEACQFLEEIQKALNHPKARTDFVEASENGVSAVARICRYTLQNHPDLLAKSLTFFFTLLPVTEDVHEGKNTYETLQWFLENNSDICNKHTNNLMLAVTKVAVIEYETESESMMTENTRRYFTPLLKQWLQSTEAQTLVKAQLTTEQLARLNF